MAPEAGDASMIFSMVQATSLEDAGNKLVEKYGLKVTSAQNGKINGFDALRVLATQTSEAQELAVIIHLIKDGNNIYDFIAATTPQSFSKYESVANTVARGFERLTDPARLNVEPKRIQVVEVRTSKTLRDALGSSGVAPDTMEEHAVLNGMELSEKVPAGTLIKIISSNAAITRR